MELWPARVSNAFVIGLCWSWASTLSSSHCLKGHKWAIYLLLDLSLPLPDRQSSSGTRPFQLFEFMSAFKASFLLRKRSSQFIHYLAHIQIIRSLELCSLQIKRWGWRMPVNHLRQRMACAEESSEFRPTFTLVIDLWDELVLHLLRNGRRLRWLCLTLRAHER